MNKKIKELAELLANISEDDFDNLTLEVIRKLKKHVDRLYDKKEEQLNERWMRS